MKIGIIGNMNNAYFSVARYLRDEGYDCELLILANEPAHFDPSCDTASTDYTSYCRHVSWGEPADFRRQDFSKVASDLSPYDFLIGNGPAPAYVNKINRCLDVVVPYGYDIYSLPFLRLVHPRRQLAYAALSYHQLRGIRQSPYFLFDRTNPASEKMIQKLGYTGTRIVSPAPMLYHKDYEESFVAQQPANPFVQKIKNLRAENELLLMQHSRQVWKHSSDVWSYKGNHHLIEGYAQFLRSNSSLRSKLILLEYGSDVHESKKLIARLNISDNIVWLPQMARSELMAVLSVADMVIGELHHSWLSYGVALEALCLARPFMQKRNDEDFAADYPELYPMLHAHSADTVCAGIFKLVTNKQEMIAMGQQGQEWFKTYCVQRPIKALVDIIERKRQAAHA